MNQSNQNNSFFSVVNFSKQVKEYIFTNNEKYIKWGVGNDMPNTILTLYNTVPEHASAIDFIVDLVVGSGITSDLMSYWDVKKVVVDFITFGGYTVMRENKRNGKSVYKFIPIDKCRLSPDKKKIGVSESWLNYKSDVVWYDNVSELPGQPGIIMFKSSKSREDYPRPAYFSAQKSLDIMLNILDYHLNNAENGFTPNVVINFNNGEPDEDTKKDIEKKIQNKFTGAKGNKFILAFNESKETAITIEKLDNDNLDQKFETLQKFIQNQIIIAHKIPSGQLIGVKAENQGFSATEYQESLEVFKNNSIKGFTEELEYGLSKTFEQETKFIYTKLEDK